MCFYVIIDRTGPKISPNRKRTTLGLIRSCPKISPNRKRPTLGLIRPKLALSSKRKLKENYRQTHKMDHMLFASVIKMVFFDKIAIGEEFLIKRSLGAEYF